MGAIEPEIIEFGPRRVIGESIVTKNENGECPALWNGFLTRMDEIQRPDGDAFGICRCVPGLVDGSFEYIAGVTAKHDAPIPDGMIEVNIDACTYAVFTVPSLADMHIWFSAGKWVEESQEWDGFCVPDGKGSCGCTTQPSFEYYPPEFGLDGKLYIYMPIKKKEK